MKEFDKSNIDDLEYFVRAVLRVYERACEADAAALGPNSVLARVRSQDGGYAELLNSEAPAGLGKRLTEKVEQILSKKIRKSTKAIFFEIKLLSKELSDEYKNDILSILLREFSPSSLPRF